MTTDDTRLQQILKNLLSNAFKFTAHGHVSLHIATATEGWTPGLTSLATASRVIAFTIQDTGIGIPADKQRVIFEAFQQADGSTSRKYGGTGLGLTISRELTMRLGGDLRLMRSAPEEGSVFTLFLPIAEPPSAEDGSRIAEKPQPPIRAPRLATSPSQIGQSVIPHPHSALDTSRSAVDDDRDTIQPGDRVLLIIEDDVPFARILLERAQQLGFKGLVALQGMQGLALAQQFKPAAITLDLNLPDVNGWVVLDQLKSRPNRSPVISPSTSSPPPTNQSVACSTAPSPI
ncbi:MAG: response regulator [Deltaproteobacteria bacterium]|nr:response regulator [Deltaproteobacteria bacterium]